MGRLLGLIFGFMVGHIPGAIIGFYLGGRFDAALAQAEQAPESTSSPRGESAYFIQTTFQIMGFVAKANGRIQEIDLQAARGLMQEMGLNAAQMHQAMHDFNLGKQYDYPWHLRLRAFAAATPASTRQQFLALQLRVAMQSGLTPTKYRCLERIAAELGVPLPRTGQGERQQEQARKSYSYSDRTATPDALARAYTLLGIPATATDAEVKKAYRRQMQRHHPDRLAGRNLSPGALERAKEKTQQIQDALEMIEKARGNA